MPDSNVITYHNDISRTGAYLAETILTPANVKATTFGKLYERTIQGDIYAQPLFVEGVHTPSGTKNLFFIATSTNDLYAFDADDTNSDPYAGLIWHRNLNPWRPLVIKNEICTETVGTVGVTSTPVIDIATQTMYVVTRRSGGTIVASNGSLYQLHNDGKIWHYTGTPLTGWQMLDNNPATVEIVAAGPDLYQLHRTGLIWKYNGTPLTGWQMLDNNPATVKIVAAGPDLYQLHRTGLILKYTGTPLTGWQMLDNNPATVQITASGGNLYQLHRTGLIWKYTGTPLTGWQLLDNNPATVQIVAAGPDLYQLHRTGLILKYTGTPLTGWQMLDNNPATTRIAASPADGGSALYQLHTDGTIWTYTGTPLTGWQMLDNNGATAQIVTDNLHDERYQVHIDGTIWKYTGPPLTGWQMLDNNWALNDGSNYPHAVDITDGTERRAPVRIEATDPNNSTVRFDARCQRNRPGLLLLNGVVFLGFATFSCDAGSPEGHPFHGWILGYRASDLTQLGVFCTSPDGGGAGVWQSGGGLVGAPDGSIYFETGNDDINNHARRGNSFIRLLATVNRPGLTEAGHFTPSNAATLRDGGPLSPAAAAWFHGPNGLGDTDLGSGGAMLLPGGRLIGGGKQGRYYVLDATSMHLSQDATSDADGFEGFQAFVNTWHPTFAHRDYEMGEVFGPNIHSAPIYWSGPRFIYQMSEKDYLKAFHYDPATRTVQITPSVVASGSWARPRDGMPGGFSSLSANGDHDGIVWTCLPQQDGQWTKVPGVLVAFDARTLHQLWVDDSPVPFAKFCPPTIASGKVFRPTGASDVHHFVPGKVIVYGLAGTSLPMPAAVAPVELAIHDLYLSHGGPHGPIGQPVGDEHQIEDTAGGRYRNYRGTVRGNPMGLASMQADHEQPPATCHNPELGGPLTLNSAIYWSPNTGAHVVGGEILTLWREQGAEKGPLGYPTSDETNTADSSARVSYFEHGDIVWYPGSGPTVRMAKPNS